MLSEQELEEIIAAWLDDRTTCTYRSTALRAAIHPKI